ncbi:MAG: glycosyltransferase family A protein [Pseudomonadota bacterium]
MKVSVIVPCFNAEATLADAHASVTVQDGVDCELILVDDGSHDRTPAVITEIAAADASVRTHLFEENVGVSAARNRGLELATGDFVFFLDADDRLRPDCLATLLAAAEAEVDFVRAKHHLWTAETGETRPNPDEERNFGEIHGLAPSAYPAITSVYSSWNALFRRSVIEEGALRFETDMRLGEDRHFNLRFFERARRVTFLNAYTYLWRKDAGETQQATRRLTADPALAFENVAIYAAMAGRPWMAALPRHRLHLYSTMVVEMANRLTAFSREINDGNFDPQARAHIAAALAAIPADEVEVTLPSLKGWTEVFLPLYHYVAQHVGRPVEDAFFKDFNRLLGQVRRALPQNQAKARRPGPRGDESTAREIITAAFRRATERRGSAGRGDDIAILRKNGLLDPAHYRAAYADVARNGADAVSHYVEVGAAELRDPNPWFDTAGYLRQHPELLVTGINPLVHFALQSHMTLPWRT